MLEPIWTWAKNVDFPELLQVTRVYPFYPKFWCLLPESILSIPVVLVAQFFATLILQASVQIVHNPLCLLNGLHDNKTGCSIPRSKHLLMPQKLNMAQDILVTWYDNN